MAAAVTPQPMSQTANLAATHAESRGRDKSGKHRGGEAG